MPGRRRDPIRQARSQGTGSRPPSPGAPPVRLRPPPPPPPLPTHPRPPPPPAPPPPPTRAPQLARARPDRPRRGAAQSTKMCRPASSRLLPDLAPLRLLDGGGAVGG